MMVMTAKVDKKKIALILTVVAVIVVALVLFLRSGDSSAPTAAPSVATNDGRVKFLTSFGWDVANSPVESSQVRIPKEPTEVFERYNALQKSQGYDLSQFSGKTVMRYVYKINNYPGATDPVYATVLVYKDQIIGGDVTDTAAKGVIRGFQMPQKTPAASQPTVSPTQEPSPTQGTVPQST